MEDSLREHAERVAAGLLSMDLDPAINDLLQYLLKGMEEAEKRYQVREREASRRREAIVIEEITDDAPASSCPGVVRAPEARLPAPGTRPIPARKPLASVGTQTPPTELLRERAGTQQERADGPRRARRRPVPQRQMGQNRNRLATGKGGERGRHAPGT